MYAIAFDLDTETLKSNYHNASHTNAYGDIRKVLEKHGFSHQQGSVYFGGKTVNAVTCVIAIMEVSSTFAWFSPSVSDVRMLRIEEDNDLKPAVVRSARTP